MTPEQIRADRQAIHGDPFHNAFCTGMQWTAILNEHFRGEVRGDIPVIPPHVVHLMMVAFKVGRAARPYEKRDRDDYLDAHNYLTFAEEANEALPSVYKCDACNADYVFKPREGASNSGLCQACYIAGLEESLNGPRPSKAEADLTALRDCFDGTAKTVHSHASATARMQELSATLKPCPVCNDAPCSHNPECYERPKVEQEETPRKHMLWTAKECSKTHSEDKTNCPVCDYGLGVCKICGRGESQLDEDGGVCPGEKLPKEQPKEKEVCKRCNKRYAQLGSYFCTPCQVGQGEPPDALQVEEIPEGGVLRAGSWEEAPADIHQEFLQERADALGDAIQPEHAPDLYEWVASLLYNLPWQEIDKEKRTQAKRWLFASMPKLVAGELLIERWNAEAAYAQWQGMDDNMLRFWTETRRAKNNYNVVPHEIWTDGNAPRWLASLLLNKSIEDVAGFEAQAAWCWFLINAPEWCAREMAFEQTGVIDPGKMVDKRDPEELRLAVHQFRGQLAGMRESSKETAEAFAGSIIFECERAGKKLSPTVKRIITARWLDAFAQPKAE